VDIEEDDVPSQDEDDEAEEEPNNALTALLANALSLSAADSVTSELIANATGAIHQT
jgi:hypothetical protein